MKEKKDKTEYIPNSNKEYNLEELLKKSPMEITEDEMMFVLDNMNLEEITAAAMEKSNLVTKKANDEK
jgi:hypothetical protein